jgi:hypothetical protein
MMSTTTNKLPTAPWSSDVEEFASATGVAPCLPKLVEATQLIFPTAHRISVYTEDDPEIANDRHIVLDVEVKSELHLEWHEARRRWNSALFALCPRDSVCVFRLRLDLQD